MQCQVWLIWARLRSFFRVKINNVAEVNQQRWLDEGGQWLENVDCTHLVLASGKPDVQKRLTPTKTRFPGPRFDERGETTTLTVEREGLFDVAVNKVLPEMKLKPETVFKCIVAIPGTDVLMKEETLYFPGKGG